MTRHSPCQWQCTSLQYHHPIYLSHPTPYTCTHSTYTVHYGPGYSGVRRRKQKGLMRRSKSNPALKHDPDGGQRTDHDQADRQNSWSAVPKVNINDSEALRKSNMVQPESLSSKLTYLRYPPLHGTRFIHRIVRTWDGYKCVAKTPRRNATSSSIDDISLAIHVATRATYIVANFMRAMHAECDEALERYRSYDKRDERQCRWIENIKQWDIRVNVPIRYYDEDEDEDDSGMLIEPFLRGFKKFNSNTGWVHRSSNSYNMLMQALSHYSYAFSNGEFLLCNLKGGIDWSEQTVTLCNPVIVTRGKGGVFGSTDNGDRGIKLFFKRYECSELCERWPRPSVSDD